MNPLEQEACARLAEQIGQMMEEHLAQQKHQENYGGKPMTYIIEPLPNELPTLEEYVAEVRRLEHQFGYLTLPLSFVQLMTLIGACQLAMRHPQFPPNSKQILNELINDIAGQLHSPVLLRHILAGFDPQFDVEASET